MSVRDQFIASKLKGLLDRRTPPQALRDRPDGQRDELASLARAVLRYAPNDGLEAWWKRFEDQLLSEMSTFSWPHAGDVHKAGKAVAPRHQSEGPRQPWEPDAHAINARRMNDGEAVGDEWIYGRRAVELERQGLVSMQTFSRYRSALFFSMADLYGDEKAKRMEDGFRKRHADALDVANKGGFSAPKVNPRRIPQVAE